jgi:predicted nucleotidyltransferase
MKGGVNVFDTLSYIGKKLNEERIVWGVGGSIMLNHYGIIDKPNDIDILVDLNDIEKADKIIKSIGEKKEWEKEDTYSTQHFYEYIVNDIDVDVMSGLTINYDNGIFRYIFDESSISDNKKINGVNIPLTSLEDWYVLYQLIPKREIKVRMIENYLLLNGVKRPDLLERSLRGDLPKQVRDKINGILQLLH